MGEYNPLDHKIKSLFSGFFPDPPEHSWERIRNRMDSDKPVSGEQRNLIILSPRIPRTLKLIMAIAAIGLIVFLSVVWLLHSRNQSVSGSAWAGEERLCRGTASLFEVKDIVKPYDSITKYREVPINDRGQYHFPSIEKGRYLLRVIPEEGSVHSELYKPAWFDQRDSSNHAHLIEVENEDVVLTVVLPRK